MQESLLQTKLYIPPLRPNLVPRPRLIDRLNQGLQLGHKLILISAPAGFGKTTLANEWVKQTDDGGALKHDKTGIHPYSFTNYPWKVAWLSLDSGDNDPTRFLTYLVAALQAAGTNVREGVLDMLRSSRPAPSEAILTGLLNEIAAVADHSVLILDDYHLIDAKPIDKALTFLLEHIPPQMHLVIVTREDPDLPLARLRVRDQLTELRAADLRFTSSEAAAFLEQAMGLDLSAEEVMALERRTEGWIAGLQLAAVSMRGHDDTAGLVKSFTGTHRLVLDFLVEEVWNQQTQEVQDFLLQTAILNRLTGALCDSVTGRGNSQAILEQLDRANVFIIPLDNERRWYRYHHLFADLMRRRLRKDGPDQLATLHQQASKWYEQNGFSEEAIEHSLGAGDFERAARLVEEHSDALWGRGENRNLQRWLDGLPEAVVFSRPHISIYQARYQCNSGQLDAAERTLKAAELALGVNSDRVSETGQRKQVSMSNSSRARLQGRVAVTRALISSYQGDVRGIIHHASQALEELPGEDLTWRSVAALTLGNARGFEGDMAAAYEARLEGAKACEAAGDIYFIIIANLELAITLREQGFLQRTVEICQQQLQFATDHGLLQSRAVGWLQSVWGETMAEMNHLNGAVERAKEGFRLTERGGDLQMHGWSFMCMVRILFSRGDLAGAHETIQKMKSVARESQLPPWIANQMDAWQARLWLAQGNLEAADLWARDRGLDDGEKTRQIRDLDFFSLFDHVVLARILLAQGRLDEASVLLQQLLKVAEAGERTSKAIEILILQALTHRAQRSMAQANSSLVQAFDLAEPEGFIRIFVDEGLPMKELLGKMTAKNDKMTDYVRQLLAAFDGKELPAPVNSPRPMVEPLSKRELELLQLIAEGLTNQEIADRLFLSLNTVKVHARNIYGKLDVHNRTQATARARELGLLPRRIV